MSAQFKPLLASTYKPQTVLRFPYLASAKLDGIRCLIIDGVAVSRSLKPIPNKHIQSLLGKPEFNGFDGELIVGSPTDAACFRNTTTVVMSHAKEVANFNYYVFDDTTNPDAPFTERLASTKARVESLNSPYIKLVGHKLINNQEVFDLTEADFVDVGYEGMMARSVAGRYKYGRSTTNENILMKVKRFTDSEAEVIGMLELETNLNEKQVDELGHSKRSSHKENKRLANTLGTLLVKDLKSGIEFGIGTGLSALERNLIWSNQDQYIGKLVKYKFFAVGIKDKPRHPVFLGWRDADDMTN